MTSTIRGTLTTVDVNDVLSLTNVSEAMSDRSVAISLIVSFESVDRRFAGCSEGILELLPDWPLGGSASLHPARGLGESGPQAPMLALGVFLLLCP